MPLPRAHAPEMRFPLVVGGDWTLCEQRPASFSMIVVYRGLHCGICKQYLGRLAALAPDFRAIGTEPVAVSADPREKAAQAREDWGTGDLPLGYGLSLDHAAPWGLYVSSARKEAETPRFFEPGLFLVRANGELFFAATQNMPFARADFEPWLDWLPRVEDGAIPARGELDPGAL